MLEGARSMKVFMLVKIIEKIHPQIGLLPSCAVANYPLERLNLTLHIPVAYKYTNFLRQIASEGTEIHMKRIRTRGSCQSSGRVDPRFPLAGGVFSRKS